MLKIIAGEARGRELHSLPNNPGLRPILARIKKSVFDIIRLKIPNARFLDLYAGVGAVGIEALSRGSAYAALVEQDAACVRLIHENLTMLKLAPKANVFRLDVLGNLSSLPGPFDLIFLGPPYKDKDKNMLALTHPTLLNIQKYSLLAKGGLIVGQHHKKENMTGPLEKLSIFREETYGDTVVSFYKEAQ